MIYVFKTSVKYKKQIREIAEHLDKISTIEKWNFDLSDCDKILRIEATTLDLETICRLLQSSGHSCAELC